MEFGEPLHISGMMVFVSFISLLVGIQVGSIKKEHKKTD
ncbi:hypothetical protein QOZ98_000541 [Planomicrobium stackebrandtii]|uniref:Holin-like toxin n=1 Tax=Planomicrobium stackebrandtii TaxID=253160 RepID=A0ABU0GSJ6_9BACL|nr:hypothetical protein [Planomicrobium stackebrandtii]